MHFESKIIFNTFLYIQNLFNEFVLKQFKCIFIQKQFSMHFYIKKKLMHFYSKTIFNVFV